MSLFEIFLPIEGCEHYMISNQGRVLSEKSKKFLKPVLNKKIGYFQVILCKENEKPKMFYVHRLVALAFLEKKNEKDVVDHIDGNKQNNDVSNLQFCSQQENTMKQTLKKRPTSLSKFKGVSFHKKNKNWQSQIRKDGKLIFLGLFDKEEEAARAYDQKALELFGRFAMTNKMLQLL